MAQRTLDALFADGRRVVAVASKPAPDLTAITVDDECGLTLDGFLVFADEPKAAARDSLAQLAALVDQGRLRPVVSQTFPLSEGRQAFESGGHPRPPGKTVLAVR